MTERERKGSLAADAESEPPKGSGAAAEKHSEHPVITTAQPSTVPSLQEQSGMADLCFRRAAGSLKMDSTVRGTANASPDLEGCSLYLGREDSC